MAAMNCLMTRARRAGDRGFRPPRAHAKADIALEGTRGRRQMAKLQLSFACGLYDRMQQYPASPNAAAGVHVTRKDWKP